MHPLNENTEWQAAFPHLAKHAKSNPYQVPDGYFENLAPKIETAIFLNQFNQQPTFTTPPAYFENLPDEINSKIAVKPLQNLVKTDGFQIPPHYFSHLNQTILTKTSAKPAIIKLWQSRLFKYMSAACVLLFVVWSIFYTVKPTNPTTNNLITSKLSTETLLYDIDESLIKENVLENNADTDKTELENYILNNLSSRDIINHL